VPRSNLTRRMPACTLGIDDWSLGSGHAAHCRQVGLPCLWGQSLVCQVGGETAQQLLGDREWGCNIILDAECVDSLQGGLVSGLGRGNYTSLKIALNRGRQISWPRRRSSSWAKTGVGLGSASGIYLREKRGQVVTRELVGQNVFFCVYVQGHDGKTNIHQAAKQVHEPLVPACPRPYA
jgi:hypothetical protein